MGKRELVGLRGIGKGVSETKAGLSGWEWVFYLWSDLKSTSLLCFMPHPASAPSLRVQRFPTYMSV